MNLDPIHFLQRVKYPPLHSAPSELTHYNCAVAPYDIECEVILCVDYNKKNFYTWESTYANVFSIKDGKFDYEIQSPNFKFHYQTEHVYYVDESELCGITCYPLESKKTPISDYESAYKCTIPKGSHIWYKENRLVIFAEKIIVHLNKSKISMTLDEAIKHCQEKSHNNSTCAMEHKQLYEWLMELKELRAKLKEQ